MPGGGVDVGAGVNVAGGCSMGDDISTGGAALADAGGSTIGGVVADGVWFTGGRTSTSGKVGVSDCCNSVASVMR